MANLKRRPDKDLNHDNWDEEDAPEEKGEFRRANEDDLRNRRILKPRRKLVSYIYFRKLKSYLYLSCSIDKAVLGNWVS